MKATEQYFHVVLFLMLYIYALLTKHEVKMAGYWPSSFFFCIFMDGDEVEVHKNAKKKKKKNEVNIQPSWLNKLGQ